MMDSIFHRIKKWDDLQCKAHVEPHINYILPILKSKYDNHTINYIDIGANVGKVYDILTTNQLLNIEYAYLFEPNQRLYDYLIYKYQQHKNIFIFDYILSDEIREVTFDTSSIDNLLEKPIDYINFGLSHISAKLQNERRSTYKISDFIINHGLYNSQMFIKIDTENHDINILKDILSILSKFEYRPIIEFEINWTDHEYAMSILNEYKDVFNYTCDMTSEGFLIPQ